MRVKGQRGRSDVELTKVVRRSQSAHFNKLLILGPSLKNCCCALTTHGI